jgi:hypothetical protein
LSTKEEDEKDVICLAKGVVFQRSIYYLHMTIKELKKLSTVKNYLGIYEYVSNLVLFLLPSVFLHGES